jgi:transaldolase / glucose-6-phosphate isomerase
MFRGRMPRLGWQSAPRASLAQWDELRRFADAVRRDGLSRTVVCGMGGSSLAPHVLAASFADPSLTVLDSTDPSAVLAVARAPDVERTLFLVSSKSGSTVETLAFYHFLSDALAPRVGADRFCAITDPGSPLESLARARGFRAVFPHPPDVGGRYAALTVIGMLPAALLGVDGRALLERALAVDAERARDRGARLAAAVLAGRDKVVLRPPPRIARLADWIEQLVAESTGKDGRGAIPVVDDPIATPRADSEVVSEFASDPLTLGAQFLEWEYATWELATRLGVDAFDQPDVDEAKALARAELAQKGSQGPPPSLPTLAPAALRQAARPRDYLAILAYMAPRPDIAAGLEAVRAAWARDLGCATTLGFGPRYLHSTGQLHKGGPNTGLFLVVTVDDAEDAEIPTMGATFGRLKQAQARGDIRALLARGRRVAHVHLRQPGDVRALATL